MKFLTTIIAATLLTSLHSQACSPELIEEKILESVKAVEKQNGFQFPVRSQIYSYSSLLDTYAVILTYDPIQNVLPEHAWQVQVDHQQCQITAMKLK